MKTLTKITQAIRTIDTTKLTIKAGSTIVFSLMLVNVYQLANHGQTALAAYMFIRPDWQLIPGYSAGDFQWQRQSDTSGFLPFDSQMQLIAIFNNHK